MIIINNLNNIKELMEEDKIAVEVLDYLKNHFYKLVMFLGTGEKPEEFSLADDGPLILLTGDQDLKAEKLKELLPQGLLDSPYECVEKIRLKDNDNLSLWRILIIHNNEFAVEYFLCPVANFSQEVQDWLQVNCTAKNEYPPKENIDLGDIPF